MGFELPPKFQELIKKVETSINEQLGRDAGFTNGKFDLKEQASVFLAQDIVQDAVNSGEISVDDANAIFGLKLSEGAQARRAPGSGEGDGGDGGDGGEGDSGSDVTIVSTGDGGVHITINNSSNWSLTINISPGDAANIEALLNAFLKGMENITQNMLNQLIEFFNKKEDNVFQFLNQLFTLLADNSKLEIATLNKLLDALNQLGIKIDGATEIISKLLQAQLDALKQSNLNLDTLVELVKQNNTNQETQIENQEKTNEILTMIFDAIGKFSDKFGNFSAEVVAQFNKLFAMLEKGDMKYDQIIKILQAINNDTSEGNEISKQILAAIEKIDAHVTKYGDEITALVKQIAEKEVVVKVDGANVNVSIDIDAILEKLDAILETTSKVANNTEESTRLQKLILEAINKYGAEITDSLNTIINNMDGDSAKLDALLNFLQTMDEHNTENVNKLLEAIAAIELNVVVDNLKVDIDIEGIIDAITKAGGDVNANIQKILDYLKIMDGNADNRHKEVLEAIAKLGVDVVDALNNLDIDIDNVDLSAVIEAINNNTIATNNQGSNTNAWLQDIFALITELNAKVGTGGTGIDMEALKKMIQNLLSNLHLDITANVDLSGVMALLQQILAAIQDHDVNVKIEFNGDSCTVTTDDPNEGEKTTDVSDLFCARRAPGDNDATGIDNISQKTLKDGKYSREIIVKVYGEDVPKDPVFIVKGGKLYNLVGVRYR